MSCLKFKSIHKKKKRKSFSQSNFRHLSVICKVFLKIKKLESSLIYNGQSKYH